MLAASGAKHDWQGILVGFKPSMPMIEAIEVQSHFTNPLAVFRIEHR
jgi:hypothetical protein